VPSGVYQRFSSIRRVSGHAGDRAHEFFSGVRESFRVGGSQAKERFGLKHSSEAKRNRPTLLSFVAYPPDPHSIHRLPSKFVCLPRSPHCLASGPLVGIARAPPGALRRFREKS